MFIASRNTTEICDARLERLIAALRRRYPAHTAKMVARDIGAHPRTVEGWLSGSPPLWKHLDAMLTLYGDAFAAEVMLPGSPQHLAAAMRAQLETLQRMIDELRATVEGLE